MLAAIPQKRYLLKLRLTVHPNKRRKFNHFTPLEANRLEKWNLHLPQPNNLMPISREDDLEDDFRFIDDCDSDEAVCPMLDYLPRQQRSPEYVEAQSESDCMNSLLLDSTEDEASDVVEDEADTETDEEDVFIPDCCLPENYFSKKKRGKKRTRSRKGSGTPSPLREAEKEPKSNTQKKRRTKTTRDQYMRFDGTTHRTRQSKVWLCWHNTKRGNYLASHENQIIACLLADQKAEGWERKFNTHKTSMIDKSEFCFDDFRSKMMLVMTKEFWNADDNLWGQTLFLWEPLKSLNYIPETSILVGYSIGRKGQTTTKAIKLSEARQRKRKNWYDHHVAPFRDFKDVSNHVLPEEAMKEILGGDFDRISLYFISMTKRALKESIQTNEESSKILKDALRKKLNAQKELEQRKANGEVPRNSTDIVKHFKIF
jgi:hypothetical protein